MAVLDYDSITERLYKDYMDDPEQLLRDSLNGDMGGRLSILLHGYTTEITPIEYEIIVLKTYNKVFNRMVCRNKGGVGCFKADRYGLNDSIDPCILCRKYTNRSR